MTRRGPVVLAVVCVTAGLAGCSGPAGGADGFAGALERIPDTGDNAAFLAWTDVTAAEELGAYASIESPWFVAGSLGFGTIAVQREQLAELVPPARAEGASAVEAGLPPDATTLLTGTDGEAVEGFFADVEGERSDVGGGTLLQRLDDHEIVMDGSGPFPASYLGGQSVWFGDGDLVLATSRQAAEDWADPGGATVAEHEAYDGIGECLGEPVAVLAVGGDGAAEGTSLLAAAAVPDDDGRVDVWCVHATDDADALAEVVEQGLADGTSLATGQPWADLVPDPEVAVVGDWVQVTATTENPNLFVEAILRNDLSALIHG